MKEQHHLTWVSIWIREHMSNSQPVHRYAGKQETEEEISNAFKLKQVTNLKKSYYY